MVRITFLGFFTVFLLFKHKEKKTRNSLKLCHEKTIYCNLVSVLYRSDYSEEFKKVCECVSSDRLTDWESARDILLLWKIRCGTSVSIFLATLCALTSPLSSETIQAVCNSVLKIRDNVHIHKIVAGKGILCELEKYQKNAFNHAAFSLKDSQAWVSDVPVIVNGFWDPMLCVFPLITTLLGMSVSCGDSIVCLVSWIVIDQGPVISMLS